MPKYLKASKVELKIADARVIGFSISQINSEILPYEIQKVLVRVSVISGNPLPEKDFMADVLVEELIIFLLRYGYDTITFEEIVLASRLNCAYNIRFPGGDEVNKTEIFGQFMSVDYISRILNTYLIFRNILDRNLQNLLDEY